MLTENLIKGQLVELLVQTELVRYGFDISIPNYNSSKYDLIADTGDKLLRIQVKKALGNNNEKKKSFHFTCTTQNVRSSTGCKYKYTKDDIDYFATAWKGKIYLIPVEETSTTKTIEEDDINYLAENVLKDYKRFSDEELYNIEQKNKSRKTNSCIDCGKQIYYNATRCIECNTQYLRGRARKERKNQNSRENFPSREELKTQIRTKPFVQIGKEYGVSDNAIRKWCDRYSLPRKKAEIKQYSDKEWEKI